MPWVGGHHFRHQADADRLRSWLRDDSDKLRQRLREIKAQHQTKLDAIAADDAAARQTEVERYRAEHLAAIDEDNLAREAHCKDFEQECAR
jgi:hypothetical protein